MWEEDRSSESIAVFTYSAISRHQALTAQEIHEMIRRVLLLYVAFALALLGDGTELNSNRKLGDHRIIEFSPQQKPAASAGARR